MAEDAYDGELHRDVPRGADRHRVAGRERGGDAGPPGCCRELLRGCKQMPGFREAKAPSEWASRTGVTLSGKGVSLAERVATASPCDLGAGLRGQRRCTGPTHPLRGLRGDRGGSSGRRDRSREI